MSCSTTFEDRQAHQYKASLWNEYIRDRGRRYRSCMLANYIVTCTEQEQQIAALRSYAERMADHLAVGYGVTLFGPVGTGKDHLAAALCRTAILRHGKRTRWVDGMTLYGDLRTSFDGDGLNETEIVNQYRRCPVLAISDPLPPVGELTPFQASALFRIIDGRYSAQLPTIMTVNVAKGEAEKRLGTAIVDRLRHSSLLIHCNWPSYRTPENATRLKGGENGQATG